MTTDSSFEQAPEVNRPRVSLAETVLSLHETADSDETVERVAEYSLAAVGCDDAGVLLLHARNRVETAAATAEAVRRAHDLQIELGEGPCLEALEDLTTSYNVVDALNDARWPRWGRAVVDLGYRSVLSVPLATATHRYGSLNVYAARPGAFDDDDLAVAKVLARHASVSLATKLDSEGLRKAVDARKLIGMAMGMIMERYGLDSDRAFDVLRRLSQSENVKLREVARQVVENRGLPGD